MRSETFCLADAFVLLPVHSFPLSSTTPHIAAATTTTATYLSLSISLSLSLSSSLSLSHISLSLSRGNLPTATYSLFAF